MFLTCVLSFIHGCLQLHMRKIDCFAYAETGHTRVALKHKKNDLSFETSSEQSITKDPKQPK